MKLTLTMFLTLDGVHQAPGAPDEDTDGGFTRGGWSVPYGDDDFGRFVTEVFDRADAFLLGRRTYEIFASYWPRMTDPADPVASRLNDLPKYVVTGTLKSADWAGTRLVRGPLVDAVAALKAQEGRELQIHGSGALAGSLLEHDLVDTLRLLWFPVTVGTGKRLFTTATLPSAYRPTDTRVTASGVVITTYDRQGPPVYGSYPAPGDA
jgi:dihydrofolate reductase